MSNHFGKKIRNNRYHAVAEAAAIAELQGKYEQAGKLWMRAMKLARKPANAQWSEHRSQYCTSASRHGWSYRTK
ncbi:ANR family transcriptional regulator [Pantoea anthophila]|uniref:ANR family transcriptional regulator n=1 Tax=Pantoea anthophila TaxID=470931 RepID=UPI00301B826F